MTATKLNIDNLVIDKFEYDEASETLTILCDYNIQTKENPNWKVGIEFELPSFLTFEYTELESGSEWTMEERLDKYFATQDQQKKFLQNMLRREVSYRLQPSFSANEYSVSSSETGNIFQLCKEAYLSLDLGDETVARRLAGAQVRVAAEFLGQLPLRNISETPDPSDACPSDALRF